MDPTAGPARTPPPRDPRFSAPALVLPKGGGAIRSIGETFTTNPATGTGSMSIGLPISPGRAGFTPSLSLRYDSGAGNGPYGFGWTVDYPSVSRRTDRGIPRYLDRFESDVFLLSGADDLVPMLDAAGNRHSTDRDGYRVHAYRPRIEGLFARIERWSKIDDPADTFWRSITRDNVTTFYGRTPASRVTDPDNTSRIFSWLVDEVHDDKGNAAVYDYAAEDGRGVDRSLPFESPGAHRATAGRYLRRVKYGNVISRLQPDFASTSWLFELVMDYGDFEGQQPPPVPSRDWPVRPDPFSTRRSGFEIRTYRRCHRVLMFHRFEELGAAPRLVRSLTLDYDDFDHAQPSETSAELSHAGSTTLGSFLRAATLTGFADSGAARSMPPLELSYTRPAIGTEVRSLDLRDAALHSGVDASKYRWIDLNGEGLTGVVTTQGGAWWYTPNLGGGRLGARQQLAEAPAMDLADGTQFLDLAGDGLPDVVQLREPVAGFYERTADDRWSPHKTFAHLPNVAWDNPNLRFVDLTGDGHADILIAEDDVFVWHESMGEEGYRPGESIRMAADESSGPRLVFADSTDTIFLADMTGDGLSDLVRIRNGEICYWPNLGYGRFGPLIVMDTAPLFDEPDLFDPKRIRLGDIDGSGVADIVYLGRDGVRLYFNRAGNSWTRALPLPAFPRIDNVADVTLMDLLGNGTACLVWSSPLPGDADAPIRFVDLMGGQKPHLLTDVADNLGCETTISYASSTRFYVEDRLSGRPWITRLPFPVQVVEAVETRDRIRGSRFKTRHAYHHGYFDGVEREFRGFGLVEQWDTDSPAGADGEVPPVRTSTWFHTGVHLGRDHVSDLFAGFGGAAGRDGYYREPGLSDDEARSRLLPDTVLPDGLSTEEEREACRALKGVTLRQEVYGEDGTAAALHPYVVTEQNFGVRLVQPHGPNPHAVFLVHSLESLRYHYDRIPSDPRVSHQLTLQVDDFGNVLAAAAVAYGRRAPDPAIAPEDQARQAAMHVTCTEASVTNTIDTPDDWRTPVGCESRTFELTGIPPPPPGSRLSLATVRDAVLTAAAIGFEVKPTTGMLQKRLLQHDRTFYSRDDLAGPLPFGVVEARALPFESHSLAFTIELLTAVFGDRVNGAMLAEGGYTATDAGTRWWASQGRIFYSPVPDDDPAAELAHARRHFFRPCRFRDPFHTAVVSTERVVLFDRYDLLMLELRDAIGNRVTAGERHPDGTLARSGNDYRVLQPRLLTDFNGNRSAVAYDALGLTAATATMGKAPPAPAEGDSLDDIVIDLDEDVILAHLGDPLARAHEILGAASTRVLYDAFAYLRTKHTSQPQPVVTYAVVRETHAAALATGQLSRLQHSFGYVDGLGRDLQRKTSAEPGPVLERDADGRFVLGTDGQPRETTADVSPRWRTTGWVVFDNKGNQTRACEPFASDRHTFEPGLEIGMSARFFYDPIGRLVATLHPDHAWEKSIAGPWLQQTWDVNDTLLVADPRQDPDVGACFAAIAPSSILPTWFGARDTGALGAEQQAAARKAAVHASTPATIYFDALGRGFLSVRHNARRYGNVPATEPAVEERVSTRIHLDIEGNRVAVIDANGRVTTTSDYGIGGMHLHHVSMDAGESWALSDVAGQSLYAWESRGHRFHLVYDRLRRPLDGLALPAGANTEVVVQRTIYGDDVPDAEAFNLRGQILRLCDQSGVIESDRYDFKGNPLSSSRLLVRDIGTTIDWSSNPPLEPETFTSTTTFDALDRPVVLISPDGSHQQTTFNEGGLLAELQVTLPNASTPTPLVTRVHYDAKGWRRRLRRGNGVETEYTRDPATKDLIRMRSTRPGDGAVLQDLRYTFDPSGNLASIRDDAQATIYFNNQVVSAASAYTYDALYRLIDAEGREHAGQASQPQATWNDEFRTGLPHPGDGQVMRRYRQQYEYDAVGGLQRMLHQAVDGGWTRDYFYDEPSRIEPARRSNRLSRTSVGNLNPLVEALSYDAHGNLTTAAHLPVLQWDLWNRLQSTTRQVVNSGPAETTRYAYDSRGQRVRKGTFRADGSRKNERIYLGGFEIYREYDGAGTTIVLERQTLHVADDGGRLALVERRTRGADGSPAELLRHQFGNHAGSCSLELDAAGAVLSYEEYTPFGSTSYQAVRSQTDAPKRYRFAAMERDEESGFTYHGARYYAPWLGRWTSPDPLQDRYPRWDPYAYAFDSPVCFSDPSGLGPETTAEKTMRRLVMNAVNDSNEAAARLEDVKQQLKELNRQVAKLYQQGQTFGQVRDSLGKAFSDLKSTHETWLMEGDAQLRTNAHTAEQLLDIEKRHSRALLVNVESQTPVRTPLTEATNKLTQSVREARALNISIPKPPTPPPPKKKDPPPPPEEKPQEPAKAVARYPNQESGWKKFWKKLWGGSKNYSIYGGYFLTGLDFVFAYQTISAQDTTYGQVKETSFWGGRLFGAAIGAKYGAAFGPWGAALGAVLGAVIGENAVKSVFAVLEEVSAEIGGPLTSKFSEGMKALKDPEVQRYITKGVNRMTGMDDINQGFDRMYKAMDRQAQERR